MRVITGNRQSGKTEALVRWVKQGEKSGIQRVIVTFSDHEAKRIVRQYRLKEWQAVGPNGDLRLRGRDAEVAVDNVDLLLQQQFGNVTTVSLGPSETVYTTGARVE